MRAPKIVTHSTAPPAAAPVAPSGGSFAAVALLACLALVSCATPQQVAPSPDVIYRGGGGGGGAAAERVFGTAPRVPVAAGATTARIDPRPLPGVPDQPTGGAGLLQDPVPTGVRRVSVGRFVGAGPGREAIPQARQILPDPVTPADIFALQGTNETPQDLRLRRAREAAAATRAARAEEGRARAAARPQPRVSRSVAEIQAENAARLRARVRSSFRDRRRRGSRIDRRSTIPTLGD